MSTKVVGDQTTVSMYYRFGGRPNLSVVSLGMQDVFNAFREHRDPLDLKRYTLAIGDAASRLAEVGVFYMLVHQL